MNLSIFNPFLLLILYTVSKSVNGHIDTPCQHLAVHNFTPCFNLATGSSTNGSSPTAECCHELNKLSHNDIDCACLLLIGTIPAQFTFLRSLQAAVLPPSCNVSGVPFQCKGYGTPLPAPGPTLPAPGHLPSAAGPSPTGSAPHMPLPATPTGPRPEGPHIQPVLNPASDAHSFSDPTTVFTLWYIVAIAFWVN